MDRFGADAREQLAHLKNHPLMHGANVVVGEQAIELHGLDKQACINTITRVVAEIGFAGWNLWIERDPTKLTTEGAVDPNKFIALHGSLDSVAVPARAANWIKL